MVVGAVAVVAKASAAVVGVTVTGVESSPPPHDAAKTPNATAMSRIVAVPMLGALMRVSIGVAAFSDGDSPGVPSRVPACPVGDRGCHPVQVFQEVTVEADSLVAGLKSVPSVCPIVIRAIWLTSA